MAEQTSNYDLNVTYEIPYGEFSIPTKFHSTYLPNSLVMKYVVDSWTGEELNLYDNAALPYDSFLEEGDQDKKKEARAKNFNGEDVEPSPDIMNINMNFGKGEAEFKNGMKYTGLMTNSMMHGQGTLENEAIKYEGTFHCNEIDGHGKYEWDLASYEGEVCRGIRNGEGSITFKNGTTYTGGWVEGLRDGFGKLSFSSGYSYEGYWKNGLKHGNGVLRYPSGNYYEGTFEFDKKSGDGTMYWTDPNKSEKYTGQWSNDLPNGFGVQIWLDGRGNKQLRNRYVGQWKDGKRNGRGIFYYANGSKYDGEWSGDLKHGDGTFVFEDGTIYEGPFNNDKMVNRTISGQVEVPRVEEVPIAKSPDAKSPELKQTTSSKKTLTTNRVKRNVEQNPFKTMIEISDLTSFEDDDLRAEREVQNILLLYNAYLKEWYRIYSVKYEASETEEAFCLTSRQLWRFLRDCNVINSRCSIALVNRLFLQGKKNQFSLTHKEEHDVSMMKSMPVADPINIDLSRIEESQDQNVSLEDAEEFQEIEIDEIHKLDRPILFRHFVEGLVRVAFLRYANGGKLSLDNVKTTKSEQEITNERPKSQIGIATYLLFSERLKPHAGNRHAKTPAQEAALKTVQSVIDREDIQELYKHYAKKNRSLINGRSDITIEVRSVLQMLTDAGILDEIKLTTQATLEIIEKYHDPETAYSGGNAKGYLFDLLGSEMIKFEFDEVICGLVAKLQEKAIYNEEGEEVGSLSIKDRTQKWLDDSLVPPFTAPEPVKDKTPGLESEAEGSVQATQEEAKESEQADASARIPEADATTFSFLNGLGQGHYNIKDRSRTQAVSKKQQIIDERERLRMEERMRNEREVAGMTDNDKNITPESYEPKPEES